MKIRKARLSEMDELLRIYDIGRAYMRKNGNPYQWGTSYPDRELLESDIEKGELYVIVDENDAAHSVFAFILGDDPTYAYIENGEWLNDLPYGTIHRIASDQTFNGAVRLATDYARTVILNLRIDTHECNITMQKAVEKLGFKKCGIIYVSDGSPRVAYQRCE